MNSWLWMVVLLLFLWRADWTRTASIFAWTILGWCGGRAFYGVLFGDPRSDVALSGLVMFYTMIAGGAYGMLGDPISRLRQAARVVLGGLLGFGVYAALAFVIHLVNPELSSSGEVATRVLILVMMVFAFLAAIADRPEEVSRDAGTNDARSRRFPA